MSKVIRKRPHVAAARNSIWNASAAIPFDSLLWRAYAVEGSSHPPKVQKTVCNQSPCYSSVYALLSLRMLSKDEMLTHMKYSSWTNLLASLLAMKQLESNPPRTPNGGTTELRACTISLHWEITLSMVQGPIVYLVRHQRAATSIRVLLYHLRCVTLRLYHPGHLSGA